MIQSRSTRAWDQKSIVRDTVPTKSRSEQSKDFECVGEQHQAQSVWKESKKWQMSQAPHARWSRSTLEDNHFSDDWELVETAMLVELRPTFSAHVLRRWCCPSSPRISLFTSAVTRQQASMSTWMMRHYWFHHSVLAHLKLMEKLTEWLINMIPLIWENRIYVCFHVDFCVDHCVDFVMFYYGNFVHHWNQWKNRRSWIP